MYQIILQFLSWIGVVTAITGQMLINRKNILAYPVWIISCIFMLVSGYLKRDYSITVLYTVYLVLNIEGLMHWKKSEK